MFKTLDCSFSVDSSETWPSFGRRISSISSVAVDLRACRDPSNGHGPWRISRRFTGLLDANRLPPPAGRGTFSFVSREQTETVSCDDEPFRWTSFGTHYPPDTVDEPPTEFADRSGCRRRRLSAPPPGDRLTIFGIKTTIA